jgi:hypothetical protein
MDIPSEEVIALKGDHDTMCQFSSEDNEGLDRVCEKLKYSSDTGSFWLRIAFLSFSADIRYFLQLANKLRMRDV